MGSSALGVITAALNGGVSALGTVGGHGGIDTNQAGTMDRPGVGINGLCGGGGGGASAATLAGNGVSGSGAGAVGIAAGGTATANTGSGGGGAGNSVSTATTGGNGGSGLVRMAWWQ